MQKMKALEGVTNKLNKYLFCETKVICMSRQQRMKASEPRSFMMRSMERLGSPMYYLTVQYSSLSFKDKHRVPNKEMKDHEVGAN